MNPSAYFDNNATTPLHPAARQAWLETADRFWHNPSSLYRGAAAASRFLEDCRERATELLGCGEPEEIVFTSGATEANNALFQHTADTAADRNVVVTSAIEHPCVSDPVARRFPGSRAVPLPCHSNGITDISALPRLLRDRRPALVSLMAANNETGVLQPWREALRTCQEHGVAFHCDAAQWLGKLPAAGLGACDYVTGSAHKFGGPKGTGFLKVPSSSRLRAQLGGPQENRRRAGTENLAGIAAMLAAWEAAETLVGVDDNTGVPRTAGAPSPAPRDAFEAAALSRIPGLAIIAADAPRLWNTSLLLVPPPAMNLKWLTRLDALGFQVSTGSACSRGQGASEVLAAMGVPHDSLSQTLRLSSGPAHNTADWLALAEALAAVFSDLQEHKRPLTAPGFHASSPLPVQGRSPV